jgi:p-hydroxybenzoate 3-monooxygenase
LNLAVSDVFYLARALAAFYEEIATLLDCYSEMALRRVWAAVRLSWYLTSLLHRFPDASEFDRARRKSSWTT